MSPEQVLQALFSDGHELQRDGRVIWGSGSVEGTTVAFVGTCDRAAIGVDIALALAGHVLDVVRRSPGRPILLLVDNSGQELARRDELLGNNAYLAHLAKCLDVARSRGHRIVGLIYGEAVSGGFLATGMSTDACYALADVQVRVMGLQAMARITQIPLERLEALCKESPVLAPGGDRFLQLGVLHDIWREDLPHQLLRAFDGASPQDERRKLGFERGGRRLAHPVASRMRLG